MADSSRKLMTAAAAVKAIERRGMLLVFPLENRAEPSSLWSEFYPRSRMRWEWDESADGRVPRLWHLREVLSRSGEVIYVKWFRGRATFISKPLARALLAILNPGRTGRVTGLSENAQRVFSALKLDSPLSTKALKATTGLQGKFEEAAYARAMRELFSRLLIVGFGEIDDGAFPSLATGATELLFEDLWLESRKLSLTIAWALVEELLPKGSLFRAHLDRQLRTRKSENSDEVTAS